MNEYTGFCAETVSPESLGIRSSAILSFLRRMRAEGVEMHSLNILRHDKCCTAAVWAPYTEEQPQIMFSFSKSLTSTAIGFLEQEGLLKIDEKLIDIFPEFAPEEPSENLKKCDVFSLLTMTCGHHTEISGYQNDPEWIRAFMAREFVYEPGTSYMYNTAGTNVLSAIVRKKTGLTLTEYLMPRLFEPLGIARPRMIPLPDGNDMGGAGYYLSPDAMARFATFLLHRGAWNGKQLLNPDWIDRAGARQVSTISPAYESGWPDWRLGYGYQFWQCVPEKAFRADGAYGQFAVILPVQDAVITVSSASVNQQEVLTGLWEEIVPFMQEEPYPEAPEDAAELGRVVRDLALMPMTGIRATELEKSLNGTTYAAPENTASLAELIGGAGAVIPEKSTLKSISVAFDRYSLTLTAEQENGMVAFTASMAGDHAPDTLNGMPYAASACWQGENVLLISARELHAVGGAYLRLVFSACGFELTRLSTIPNGRGLFDCEDSTVSFRKL